VAELLGVTTNCVGLKAKTPEGLNTENTAIAHVVVLLEEEKKQRRTRGGKKQG
jgi:2-C-methyl-D-erythritol 2,4-cyclodiphosphate synthase